VCLIFSIPLVFVSANPSTFIPYMAYLAYHLLQLSIIIQCSHISCSNSFPFCWSESPHHCFPLVTVKCLIYNVATNSCVRKAFPSHKVGIPSLARLMLHFLIHDTFLNQFQHDLLLIQFLSFNCYQVPSDPNPDPQRLFCIHR
jgi:fucose 4-O-acetylase-like acetyltransferase